MRRALGDIPFTTSYHVRAAHAAKYGQDDGVLVAAFEDSQAVGARSGEYARAGGWNEYFGEDSSVRRVRTQALRAVARYADGRGEETSLLSAFCSRLNCWPRGLAYRIHDKHLGYTEGIVLRCASDGDLQAAKILREEAQELVSMAKAVTEKLTMPSPRVAVLGWWFESSVFLDVFTSCMQEQLPNSPVEMCDRPVVEGAAIMAKAKSSGYGE